MTGEAGDQPCDPWTGRKLSGGAMVLGELPVPGRPTNLDNRGVRA